MQAHKLVFVLLILGGLLTSFLVYPRKQELALMYLKAGNFKSAELLYEDLFQENTLNRATLVPLMQVYLTTGHVEKIIRIYELYLKQNLNDLEVLEQLAKLYRDTYRYYDYMRALEKIDTHNSTPEHLDELYKLYISFGMKKNAIASLTQLVEIDPERQKEYRQLISLQTSVGDYVGAEHSLATYITSGNPTTQILAELRLRLLLKIDRITEAFGWAKNWLHKNQDDALRFSALLYSGGKNSGFRTAFDADSVIDPNEMPTWLIENLVGTLWTQKNTSSLEVFISRLNDEKKHRFPVIMARLALNKKDFESLTHWLEIADQPQNMEPEHQAELAKIYLASGQVDKAIRLLSILSEAQKMPASLYANAATMILQAGDTEKGLILYERLKDEYTDTEISYSWALLAAAQGKHAAVEWLKSDQSGKISQLQLTNIYYAAADRAHHTLALNVAKQIYGRFKGSAQMELLAQSLLKENKAPEAVTLLRPHKDEGSRLSQLYEQALIVAWKQDSALLEKVVALWKNRLKTPGLNKEVRRQLAFKLLQSGEKWEATREFQRLAETEDSAGKNVNQLLFIWGPLPGETALDWLENKAKNASKSNLAGWWDHLLKAGGSQRILAMKTSIGVELSPEAETVLTKALISARDTSGLNSHLREQADKSLDSLRFEKLAEQAHAEGLSETEEYIWKRLIKINPANSKANRGLGIAAFYHGDRHASETYFKRYLAEAGDDWESIFYLAEIMYADGRHKAATPYFERSLTQIGKEAKPAKRLRTARALIFYRLGRKNEAMNEYDKLVEEYPADTYLRAEYSTLLIDEGQLEKARHILGEK